MKVLHFISSIDRNLGGTTAYLQLLANELGKSIEVMVVAGDHRHDPVEIENATVKLIDIKMASSLNVLGLYNKRQKIKRQINDIYVDFKPDIVHINGAWMPQLSIVQSEAKKKGIPVVLSPHGMMEPWIMNRNKWKKKIAYRLFQHQANISADVLHATADSEKINLEKLGYDQPIKIIPNGIEIDNITIKTDWSPKRKILFLSRVHPKKGIEHLIDAIATLKDHFADGQIIIAGEGEDVYIEQLKQKIKSQGVEPLFEFIGGVYGDQKWQLFKEADIFVLPTYSENFGIVVVEALASGTPVITTVGAPWEELVKNKCGWWTELGTEPLLEVLRQYLEVSADGLRIMGENGRKLVVDKYSSKKMTEDMIALYKECLNAQK
ncbi:MAG: glycosyltransferase [Bacteroidota bacterium]|nr:glycosyltransferase [Bacteroidota bacterium]